MFFSHVSAPVGEVAGLERSAKGLEDPRLAPGPLSSAAALGAGGVNAGARLGHQ
jgi:hypothetical protein